MNPPSISPMDVSGQYHQEAKKAVQLAQEALRAANKPLAYHWAAQAARLDPQMELAWLILAAVGEPAESVRFLEKALQINPQSEQARRGLQWARNRLHNSSILDLQNIISSPEDTNPIKISPVRAPAIVSERDRLEKKETVSISFHALTFVIKKLAYGILTLLLFATLVFFGMQFMLPGDFASQYALSLGSQGTQALRETLGINLPIWQQYLKWITHLLQGDFGLSYTLTGFGDPVLSIILKVLPSTIFVYGLGTILAFFLGNSLGKEIAFRKQKTPAAVFVPVGILLYTSFPPWLVFLMMYVIRNVIYKGYWAPSLMIRNVPVGFPPELLMTLLGLLFLVTILLWGIFALIKQTTRREIPLFLFLLLIFAGWIGCIFAAGLQEQAYSVLQKAAVPILAFTLLTFGEILLLTRTTMRETMVEEYILLAKAKGLPPSAIRDRHAARNALLPVMTRMAISIPYLLSGMVMIEMALNWPGLGTTLFFAIGMQNVPLMMGTLIFNGILILIVRIGLEFLLSVLDPRIRTQTQGTGAL